MVTINQLKALEELSEIQAFNICINDDAFDLESDYLPLATWAFEQNKEILNRLSKENPEGVDRMLNKLVDLICL